MAEPLEPVTTTSSSLTPLYGGGIVQQSHSAAANATDVAASTTTAISVPGGTGTKSSAAAASGGNVAAIQTTITEQATGHLTQIDVDPRAQLAFYLHCISSVLDGFFGVCNGIIKDLTFGEFKRLLDYKNFRRLTEKECDKLLLLADALPPTLFINKVFFENSQKCKGSSNKFYKIEEVEKSLAIQNDVMFRGENRHVSEIMYYTPNFFKNKYYEPMRSLEHRLRAIRKGHHL